jgi:2,3-bisphosphoglycerate-independent phosphoglycerate mutase
MNKYIICLGDGMSDYPIKEIGNKTPLEKAHTPNMDFIAKNGQAGLILTIPEGFEPGSDVANMSVLGYDPQKYYTGRGPIEAVSLGIEIPPGKVAFRCNFVFIQDNIMKSFSAEHITKEESAAIIDELNDALSGKGVQFYTGVSYRHILLADQKYLDLKCIPPHDITDKDISEYLPIGTYSEELLSVMHACNEIMAKSKINKQRISRNLAPANHIWPWGQGSAPALKSFQELYGHSGGVITAVDLLKGLGMLAKLETPNIEGATGYIDTNYKGKIKAALKILENKDFVYIHIEAPDEAGHLGDVDIKIKAIEDFDRKVVGEILKYQADNPGTRVMVLPDHATPCELKTHTKDPVPVALYYQGIEADAALSYSENEVKQGTLSFPNPWELLKYFLY